MDGLLDALDGSLPEWAVARQRPRAPEPLKEVADHAGLIDRRACPPDRTRVAQPKRFGFYQPPVPAGSGAAQTRKEWVSGVMVSLCKCGWLFSGVGINELEALLDAVKARFDIRNLAAGDILLLHKGPQCGCRE
jgi:hypothetical protein